jgi:hypothetical protein
LSWVLVWFALTYIIPFTVLDIIRCIHISRTVHSVVLRTPSVLKHCALLFASLIYVCSLTSVRYSIVHICPRSLCSLVLCCVRSLCSLCYVVRSLCSLYCVPIIRCAHSTMFLVHHIVSALELKLSYGDGVTCVDLKVLNVPDMNGPLGPVDVKNIPL